jgi:hypothetical protein
MRKQSKSLNAGRHAFGRGNGGFAGSFFCTKRQAGAGGNAGTVNFIVLLECGRRWSLLAYAAVSLISILLLPTKAPAVLYAAFFGYYPIIKSLIERLGRPRLEWPLKLLLALASLTAVLLVYKVGFLGGAELPHAAVWAVYAAGLLGFAAYDVLLSKLIETYIRRKIKKR